MADEHIVKKSSTKVREVAFAVGDPAVKSVHPPRMSRKKSEINILYCPAENK